MLPRLGRLLERAPQIVDFVTDGPTSFLVREDGAFRELVEIGREELVHTRVRLAPRGRVSGFPYTDMLHLARAIAADEPASALCLGAGGGIVPRQLAAAGLVVDVVERSAAVLALAGRHFDLASSPLLSIHQADAGAFLARAEGRRERWDLVVVDLFGAREASPLVAQAETIAKLRAQLRPGGAIAINAIGSLDEDAGALRATTSALGHAFDVVSLPVLSEAETSSGLVDIRRERNVVVLGARDGLPAGLLRAVGGDDLPAYASAATRLASILETLAAARAAAAAGRPLSL